MPAIGAHPSTTVTSPWNAASNEARLPSPPPRKAYAWQDTTATAKSHFAFPHHIIAADGTVGPANLIASAAGIGILNGARGAGAGARWWKDRNGIYAHLAAHLRAAGRTPPSLRGMVASAAPTIIRLNLTAAAVGDPIATIPPPADWFDNPNFTNYTPLTITDQGRVHGHAARWDSCHLGFSGRCVSVPHSPSDYAWFHLGEIVASNKTHIHVGTITLGGGHASDTANAAEARRHYDDVSSAVAYVRAGEDEFGIWFSGALAPGITPETLVRLRGSKMSGDWRRIDGALEMVAVHAVNTPGFPVPRLALAADGYPDTFIWSEEEPMDADETAPMLPKMLVASGGQTYLWDGVNYHPSMTSGAGVATDLRLNIVPGAPPLTVTFSQAQPILPDDDPFEEAPEPDDEQPIPADDPLFPVDDPFDPFSDPEDVAMLADLLNHTIHTYDNPPSLVVVAPEPDPAEVSSGL